MPLLRIPCLGGYSPVSMDVCDGSVMGATAWALENRTPARARPSMWGVTPGSAP